MGYTTRTGIYAPPSEALQKAYDYDVDGNMIYEGWAKCGEATSAASWLIVKKTYTDGNMTAEQLAAGTPTFDQVWDNRAALSYS